MSSFKRSVKFLFSLIESFNEYTAKFYGILIVALVLIMVVEVVRRYGFNAPIMGIQDVDCAYFGAYYTMAAAYTLAVAGHVRVDVVWSQFSPRNRAIIDLVTFPIFALFLGGMLYSGWVFGMNSTWVGGAWNLEVDQSHLRLPLYPLKWTLFIGCVMLTAQALINFVRDLTFAATGREL
jgi:TRAP-type mannitol/chloroaromatic compound transport system permease small subunit